MDMISQLSDELLLTILSLLPTTNDVVATMVLSKRWKFLWMFVPKLVYDDSYQNIEYARFSRFVDRSLFLHEAPVIKTLHFKLGEICGAEDIRVWIKAAEKSLWVGCLSSSTALLVHLQPYFQGACTQGVECLSH
ncbi:putative FBD-associated F-box protein [Cardamine amara subsp. amara]|uniref:FBD-associated F-box protein n=1 Tax=Cardamine amara subsp. amara TaxID=228776 RepID=A0ABD0ZKQ5_CARAN